MNSDTDFPFRPRPDDPGRPGAIAVARLRVSSSAFVLILASSLALPGEGRAASDQFTFKIPAKPRSEALIDLGVQARVTLGGVSACPGRSPAVVGTLTLKQALGAVTAGAPCRFEILDNATVSILPAPPAPRVVTPPPSPRPAPISEPAKAIESVIVTATKRPTRLGAAAGGVSVVGAERLEDTGAIDTTSISQQAAGFITTNLGAARNKIMLRGLSDGTFTGRTQQTVGTYLDNIPLTYNAPDPDLRLIDVDRVEILRGPQGALYGGGSLSGVYRIVTRKPVLNEWSAMALVGAAATESGSPSSRLEGVVNLPLVTDRAALRLTAYDDIEGGYVDDVNLRLSNVDRTTRTGGRAALSVVLDDNWSVILSGARQDLHATDSQYTTPSLGGQRRANQVRETHDNVLQQAAVTITGKGDWGRFESSTGYVRHRFASRFDATAALNGAGDGIDVGLFDEASKVRILVEDAVLSSPDEGRLRWLLGLYGLASLEDGDGELRARTAFDPSRLIYLEARRDRRREAALYGEASYDLGGGWTASLGGRAFSNAVHTTSMVEAPAPGQSRDLDRKARFTGVSPKFSLQRPLGTDGLIYLLTSEGYRSGGFNSGGLVAPSTLRGSFKPDHLRNYEIGASIRPLQGRMLLRTALFHDVWTDIQTDQYLAPSGLSYTANVGDGRNTGLEIEGTLLATPSLTLEANALFNRPRLSKVDDNFASAAQSELPGVPDVSAGAMARYQRDLAAERWLVLTAELEYVGRSRLTFDRRLSPSMGGYVTGRLSATVSTPNWNLAFAVANPANASSDTFAYGNPFSFGQVRQVTPLRPRTWSLDISRAF